MHARGIAAIAAAALLSMAAAQAQDASKRRTRRDRMQAKIKEVAGELRRRMHQSIPEQGKWLKQVITGFFNYHAVPTDILKERVEFIEYGKPEELSDKQRAKLNCDLLKQVLIHRAERLMTATGQMLVAKNLYGLALTARGHIETVAMLGYFTKRLAALSRGNIDFDRFEQDIANGLMGAKHDLFDKANAPVNIMTCIENTDKHLDAEFFKEKKKMLEDLYSWLSEFAHPNFCSNKTAYTLDKATGRMVLRKDEEITEDHFQMLATLDISAGVLLWLLEDFTKRVTAVFPDE
jgi:hypothetical protein